MSGQFDLFAAVAVTKRAKAAKPSKVAYVRLHKTLGWLVTPVKGSYFGAVIPAAMFATLGEAKTKFHAHGYRLEVIPARED